jgi:hypothetical protein
VTASEPGAEPVRTPIVWVGVDDLPVHYANQFVIQVHEREIFLTAGVLIPPPIVAPTKQELQEQARKVEYVGVRPVARLALNRRRLEELRDLLSRGIDLYDTQAEGSA